MIKNLEGTSGEPIEHEYINKPADIKNILLAGKVATTAEDNGAINVWKDNEGFIRCESMRYCVSLEKKRYKTFPPAITWTRKWMKLIR